MSRILCCLSALLVFAATSVFATTTKGDNAYVISVDAATKSIRLRFSDPKWSDVVAKWDENTKWYRDDYETKVVDSNLVKTLKKDSKVYVFVNDRGSDGKTWWVEELDALPADATAQ